MINVNCRIQWILLPATLSILMIQHTTAQQLKLVKTSIASGYHSRLSSSLSATVGQSGPISAIGGNGIRLYQGFEHPFAFNHTEKFIQESAWELFPNPARDRIYIRNTNYPVAPCRIEILDSHGSIAIVQFIDESEVEGAISLDVRYLASGAYFVRMSSSAYPATVIKLIKL